VSALDAPIVVRLLAHELRRQSATFADLITTGISMRLLYLSSNYSVPCTTVAIFVELSTVS